jgi:hypothetical protein
VARSSGKRPTRSRVRAARHRPRLRQRAPLNHRARRLTRSRERRRYPWRRAPRTC